MKHNTTPIVLFYVLYFFWLFTVTYLTQDLKVLNYFTIGVALFYLVLLRESGDIPLFLLASLIPVVFTATSFKGWELKFNFDLISYLPVWLPLAWGTTVCALRKFYIVTVGA